MKQIKLFLSSIVKTLDGKLMFVNFKSITLNTDPIVISHLTWHKLLVQLKPIKNKHWSKVRPKPKPKQNYSVKKPMISRRYSRKFNNGAKPTRMLKISQTRLFQKTTISEISMDTISLVKLEIKEVVVHAIPCPSLRLLNLDLR